MRMPGLSGLEVLGELKKRGATVVPIVISGTAEIDTAVAAMKLGAQDLIEKPFSTEVLLTTIEAVWTKSAPPANPPEPAPRDDLSGLTPRERDVLRGLVAGLSARGTAEVLGISERTVEMHRASMMKRLAARSRAEAVIHGVRAGLPPLLIAAE